MSKWAKIKEKATTIYKNYLIYIWNNDPLCFDVFAENKNIGMAAGRMRK